MAAVQCTMYSLGGWLDEVAIERVGDNLSLANKSESRKGTMKCEFVSQQHSREDIFFQAVTTDRQGNDQSNLKPRYLLMLALQFNKINACDIIIQSNNFFS